MPNLFSVFRIDLFCCCCFCVCFLQKVVNLRLSIFEVFNSNLNILKYSESITSENNHALPENIVLMYYKVFLNSKLKFSRKLQNKSVCVRRFLRCSLILPTYKTFPPTHLPCSSVRLGYSFYFFSA